MGYAVALAWEVEAGVLREVAGSAYGSGRARREGGSRLAVVGSDAGPAGSSGEPDPGIESDLERIEELGDEIATLAAHIHAATHRLLVLLAEFDRLRGWEAGGHRSCAHWLSFRTGLDLGTAREHVRVARALENLPGTGEAMGRGELSFSKARALTRVAESSSEAELLELARECTTAQLERVVRGWKKGSREEEGEGERERHRSRRLSVFPDDDGMYVVEGRLEPEVGALLMRAVEAASDALYRERGWPEGEREPEREAARWRADALALVAERALAAGFGGSHGPGPECACGRAAPGAPLSGTRAERYQVVVHVEPATLAAEGEPGRSELEDGTRVSAETCRRIACDTGVITATRAPDGSTPDVGRRTRTIPPALRRALEARDRGCRFPGCGLRFTDAHHVVHWADGGETSLRNTLLLCRYHHRLVHEGGWEVEWWGEGRPAFRDPRGQIRFDGGWRPPELPRKPVEALLEENRLRGAEPDAWTAGARWTREADIPAAVLFRAMEAAL